MTAGPVPSPVAGSSVDLSEEVVVAVEEGAVDPGRAGDGGHAVARCLPVE